MESLLPVPARKAAGGGLALRGGGSPAEVAGDGKADGPAPAGSRAPCSQQMSSEAESPQSRWTPSPEQGGVSFIN